MYPASARLAVFLSVLALCLGAETAFAARPWKSPRWRRLGVHIGLSAFNSLLLRLSVMAPLVLWMSRVWEQGWGLMGGLGLEGPLELALSFVAYDVYEYGWHRANHRLPWLWRFHRAHHLDDHVDVTTALRFHPGELLLSAAAKALFIGLWGPSLLALALAETGISAAAQFHHSNVEFPERWERLLRRLIMTPRVHASHHTVTQRSRDANYATIFSPWDRLFGSFAEPDASEMRRLGLPGEHGDVLSPWLILRAPFEKT